MDIFFCGGGQLNLITFGGSFLSLRAFFKEELQNGNIFVGMLKFQVFWGVCLIQSDLQILTCDP